jgi:hypothetical protein
MSDKVLIKVKEELFYFIDGKKVSGAHSKLYGNCLGLYGDCSGLYGNCSNLYGDCSGLYGDCSKLYGNCLGLYGDLDLIKNRPASLEDCVKEEENE